MAVKIVHRLFIEGWRPCRDNQIGAGVHWAVRARLKRADADVVRLALLAARVPDAAAKRRVRVEMVLTGRQRRADPFAYWKSLLDALVTAGGLVDDSGEWCEVLPLAQRRAAKGERGGTIITLEDIP